MHEAKAFVCWTNLIKYRRREPVWYKNICPILIWSTSSNTIWESMSMLRRMILWEFIYSTMDSLDSLLESNKYLLLIFGFIFRFSKFCQKGTQTQSKQSMTNLCIWQITALINRIKNINQTMTKMPVMDTNGLNKLLNIEINRNCLNLYKLERSLNALWTYLRKKGINTDKIWENITDLVIKTIIW